MKVGLDRPKSKRVLLINAVTWSDAYPVDHPYRDVRQWFARWLVGIPSLELVCLSAGADLLCAVRRGVDGVIISGSPRDAWGTDPINEKLLKLVDVCRLRRIPVLGVCYGHQLLGRVLGAPVAPQAEGLELGNTTLTLSSAGLNSPLYRGFPEEFEVVQSHADAVLELPDECRLLATGGMTPIQCFDWNGRLMGVQFHPEQEPETIRFIWSARRDKWRDKVSFDLDECLDNLRPTPLATRVLRNFVKYYVL